MSLAAFKDTVRSMMPGIVTDPDNHKHTAVITIADGTYIFHADRHGWIVSRPQCVGLNSLRRRRDASPLSNAQAFAVYLENL
jgi:hypothetical protein